MKVIFLMTSALFYIEHDFFKNVPCYIPLEREFYADSESHTKHTLEMCRFQVLNV